MTTRTHAVLIFACALSLRLAYVLKTGVEPGLAEVTRAAVSVARHGIIGNVYTDGSGPSSHVSPLYPLLLGGIYRFIGVEQAIDLKIPQMLSALAAAGCMALMPLAALGLGLPVRAGIAAGWVLALTPVYLWVECSGSWEQPYAALALVWLAIQAGRMADGRGAIADVSGMGLALGISALLNPSVFMAGCLLLTAGALLRPGPCAGSILRMVAVAGVCAVMCVPWAVRNWNRFGRFVPLRGNFGLELRAGNNPYSEGKTFETHTPEEFARLGPYYPISNPGEARRLELMGETAYMAAVTGEARQYIRSNPGRFAYLCWNRFRYFWFPPPHMLPVSSGGRGWKTGFMCVVSATGLLGLSWFFKMGHSKRWLIACAVLGAGLSYLLTHVSVRYRYPVHCMLVLAGCGLVSECVQRMEKRKPDKC